MVVEAAQSAGGDSQRGHRVALVLLWCHGLDLKFTLARIVCTRRVLLWKGCKPQGLKPLSFQAIYGKAVAVA
jgi:hypothetical protein